MNDNKIAITSADEFVKEHIVECAKELVELYATGILKSGKIRQLADIVRVVVSTDALTVAINMVNRACVEVVAK